MWTSAYTNTKNGTAHNSHGRLFSTLSLRQPTMLGKHSQKVCGHYNYITSTTTKQAMHTSTTKCRRFFYYTVWSVSWINIQKSGHLDLSTLQVDTRSLTKFYQVHMHTRFVLNWPSFSVSQEAGLGHPKTEHL